MAASFTRAGAGSEHRTILRLRLGRQRIARVHRPAMQDTCGDILADRWTMLEAMPGASTHQPNVGEVRVAVDQEIAVGRVLVLADARLHQGRMPQSGQALAEEIARGGERIGGWDAVGGGRVDGRAVLVEGDFDAAVFQIGKTVGPARIAEVDPHRHGWRSEARVAGRCPKEERLLARGHDAFGEQIRKQFGQPRTAGEYERAYADGPAFAMRASAIEPVPASLGIGQDKTDFTSRRLAGVTNARQR